MPCVALAADDYYAALRQRLVFEVNVPDASFVFPSNETAWADAHAPTGPQANRLTIEPIAVTGEDFSRAVRFTNPSAFRHPWHAMTNVPTIADVAEGDALLLVLTARAIDHNTPAGMVEVRFGRDFRSYDAEHRLELTGQWRTFTIPMRAKTDRPAGEATLTFKFGDRRQTVELAGVNVLNFGPDVPVTRLPNSLGDRTQWPGREPGAAWRAEAHRRIAEHRMGDLEVRVRDAHGQPVPFADVEVTQTRQAFMWSTRSHPHYLFDAHAKGDPQRRREMLPRHFNGVLGEVGHAFPQNTAGHRSERNHRLLSWAKENNLVIPWTAPLMSWREPYLMPGTEAEFEAVLRDRGRDAARAWLMDQVRPFVDHTQGFLAGHSLARVALNEAFQRSHWEDLLGIEVHVDFVRLLREANPDMPLIAMDAFAPGDDDDNKHAYMHKLLGVLADAGQAMDGIGFQCHFGGLGRIAPPEDFLAGLDDYAERYPDATLWITELDVKFGEIEDPAERSAAERDYLRDVLTAAFSHPRVVSVNIWGFDDAHHWWGDSILYDEDWNLKDTGQVWQDLVNTRWRTDAKGSTDADGRYQIRAFHGDHRVTVRAGQALMEAEVTVDAEGASAVLTLPPLYPDS
ncbi:MAG: endo-1,4-beta-xylanase [Planctomycetota bacterium]